MVHELKKYTNSVYFKPSKCGTYPPPVRQFCLWVLELIYLSSKVKYNPTKHIAKMKEKSKERQTLNLAAV